MIEKIIDAVFWAVIVGSGCLVIAALVSAYEVDKNRQAFVYACETMGGVPIEGLHHKKLCLKAETLK